MKINKVYKYCLKCGGDFQDNGGLLFCANCKFKYFISSAPCAGVLIENTKEEILLVKRKDDPFKGLWDTAGGFVGYDESWEQSQVRELKEELGVKVEESDFVYMGSFVDEYEFEGITKDTIGIIFLLRADLKDIKVSDDVIDFRWFKKSDIDLDEIAFNAVRDALRTYLNAGT